MANYEVLYIFILLFLLNAIIDLTNTLRNSGLDCRMCQIFSGDFYVWKNIASMLTLAVCFSCLEFFHYFVKALFLSYI